MLDFGYLTRELDENIGNNNEQDCFLQLGVFLPVRRENADQIKATLASRIGFARRQGFHCLLFLNETKQ